MRYDNTNIERNKKARKGSEYYESITFICKKCGKKVTTEEGVYDRRTKFCSSACERKFWRHPPESNKSSMFVYYGKPDYDLKEWLNMKKIECFKASDGMLFERYEDAQTYEEKIKIEYDLRMILNASIKENSLKSILSKNYYDGKNIKDPFVTYLTEIMLRDIEAFKDVFCGGLSCE